MVDRSFGPKAQDKEEPMRPPKFWMKQTVQIGKSPYSFRVDEVLVTGHGMYSYRGQMFKHGRKYNYGVVTERGLDR